jgi:hypothetical protein
MFFVAKTDFRDEQKPIFTTRFLGDHKITQLLISSTFFTAENFFGENRPEMSNFFCGDTYDSNLCFHLVEIFCLFGKIKSIFKVKWLRNKAASFDKKN